MTCWSCSAENDLGVTQTCLRCGAPLARPGGVFRKRAILEIAGALALIWALWFCWVLWHGSAG